MRCAAMFEKENTLPRSELHFSVDNRHGFARARQRHADVAGMSSLPSIVREVIGVFRHEAIEKFLQIPSRGGVGVFHDDETATGVLNKDGDSSVLYPRSYRSLTAPHR